MFGSNTILFAEDDENYAMLTKIAFEQAGFKHTLHHASNGMEAMAYLKGEPPFRDRTRFPLPCFVLADLKMPMVDGFELLEWIRRDSSIPQIPVVVLTCSDEMRDVKRAYALGANSFLVKPPNIEDLKEMLKMIDVYWLQYNIRRNDEMLRTGVPELVAINESLGGKPDASKTTLYLSKTVSCYGKQILSKFFLACFGADFLNHAMKFPIRSFAIFGSLCAGAILAASCATTAKSKNINLLQPDKLYSFLEKIGVDKDDDHVFSWEKDGTLRISGQHYGYMATKENYSNYVLFVEYKYGSKTWPPRENNARDGGVLCHFVGKDGVWPKSLEAQIIEGGTGDILVVSGAKLTVDGVTKGPRIERFDRPGRNPWKDEKGFRGPNEIEKPTGEWNQMKVLCEGDKFGIWVNGHKTLMGSNAIPTSGKILVQSEGAEIFFRKLELQPLD